MRIGAIGGNEVRHRDHRGRDVGVQVERHQDRHVRTDGIAHAAQQLALAVVVVFRHHRAVQLEEDRVRTLAAQPVDHDPGHALEGVARDLAARHGAAPGERDHDVPGLLGRIHEIGDREIDARGRSRARLRRWSASATARPRTKSFQVVGFATKVLVSCMKPPTAILSLIRHLPSPRRCEPHGRTSH